MVHNIQNPSPAVYHASPRGGYTAVNQNTSRRLLNHKHRRFTFAIALNEVSVGPPVTTTQCES